MKIAIIIPAYNEEKILARCLESIAKQIEPPHEVIVVDNNSTDKTSAVAQKFQTRLLHEKLQGISFARNTGFNATKADIIARIDADSVLPPDWTATLQETFTDSSVVGVSGPIYFSSFLGLKLFAPILHVIQTFLYFQTARVVFGHNVMIGSNMAIRNKIWKKVEHSVCMDNRLYHEDTDLSIHLHKYGKIRYNKKLRVITSARRFYNGASLVDYSVRHIRTLLHGLTTK